MKLIKIQEDLAAQHALQIDSIIDAKLKMEEARDLAAGFIPTYDIRLQDHGIDNSPIKNTFGDSMFNENIVLTKIYENKIEKPEPIEGFGTTVLNSPDNASGAESIGNKIEIVSRPKTTQNDEKVPN